MTRARGVIPPPWWRERQHMGPQPGMGQLNPNANGTEVPWVPAAPFKPSQPGGADPSRRIILPGCDFPTAEAIPVDEIGDGNVAGASTPTTLVTVQVPDHLTFRISGIGFGSDDESNLRFLSWTITATPPGSPILGYNQKPATIGSIPQVSYIFSVQGSSVTIRVVVANSNFFTHYYVCRLQGWFYSEREAAYS